jgi:hypothetical protein
MLNPPSENFQFASPTGSDFANSLGLGSNFGDLDSHIKLVLAFILVQMADKSNLKKRKRNRALERKKSAKANKARARVAAKEEADKQKKVKVDLRKAAKTSENGDSAPAGGSTFARPPFRPEIEKYNFTIINQILQLVPKLSFNALVDKYQTERGAKGFKSWDHFITMVFAQISGANSLREITGSIASAPLRYQQLLLDSVPAISTISYANSHRDWHLFEEAYQLIFKSICRNLDRFGLKANLDFPLYALDSSVISLCHKMYDWANYRTSKGGIKLHTFFDLQHFLPGYLVVTEGKLADVQIAKRVKASEDVDSPTRIDSIDARAIAMPKGSVIVMDRGYVDFALFYRWTQEGIYFVTRPKIGMKYEVTKELPLPDNGEPVKFLRGGTTEEYVVVSDSYIRLTSKNAQADCPIELRQVTVRCEATNNEMTFLTNNTTLSADIISQIYKDRWKIESFFRTIKQNLIIKSFLGTSINAVNCQVWSAMTAIILIKYFQMISTISWNFSNLLYLIRINLFSYIKIFSWINVPHCDKVPPKPPPDKRPQSNTLF